MRNECVPSGLSYQPSNAGETLPPELTRVDELTPFAVEWRYDYHTAPASFDRVKARDLVAKVRAFVEQQIKPAIS